MALLGQHSSNSVRRIVGIIVPATALALASSWVVRTHLEVQDWDCPPAPLSCARPVLVLGFPLPYVSDYHGISPVGRASLLGAVMGTDHFHPAAFLADVAFYALCLAVVSIAVGGVLLRKHVRVR